MNKLIIDAAENKIFLMIIDNSFNHNITYENSKINYEKLILLINEFLKSKNLSLSRISEIYINGGPGSFAGNQKLSFNCKSHKFSEENRLLLLQSKRF